MLSRHVGIDLSYSGTGFVAIDSTENVLVHMRVGTESNTHDYQRVAMIWDAFSHHLGITTPCTVSIENYAHGGHQLAKAVRLGELIRERIYAIGISYTDVAPGTLKKWATGNGRASKEEMVARAKESWPMCPNNDEADAFLLACWGLHNQVQ